MTAGETTNRCPFLREAQVKSCAAAGSRKLIVRLPGQASSERCSSPGYDQCPSAKQYRSDVVDGSHCPFLQESLVQYCAAAPVVKYIPYSESVLSRCGSGQHASCELYAAIAGAGNGSGRGEGEEKAAEKAAGNERHPAASDPFPDRLWYAPNHMWLEAGPAFAWRIGVDSFFAGVIGALDSVAFPVKRGHRVPEVLLTSGETTFTMSFPASMLITEFNMYLLSNPSKLIDDPYRAGWLFKGLDAGDDSAGVRTTVAGGLIAGSDAGPWIASEERRMTGFVHELRNRREGIVTMADGGRYQHRVFGCLNPRERAELLAGFFRARNGQGVAR